MRAKALTAIVALALALCGCTGNAVVRGENAPGLNVGQRFICDGDMQFSTVVDSRTGVTYLVFTEVAGHQKASGITALLNRDGTPVISEEVTK